MTNLFFGGVPTGPDVRRLREAFPDDDMPEGRVISYDEVEEVLGRERGSSRFETVTSIWRRVFERDTGRILHRVRQEGFKVIVDREKVQLAAQKISTAGRLSRRAVVVGSAVDRKNLTADELAAHEVLSKKAAALTLTASLRSAKSIKWDEVV